MQTLLKNQRHLFDMPDDVHYLNGAYMSPLLNNAVKAGEAAVQSKTRPWLSSSKDFFSQTDVARRLFAELIGAQQNDIAVVPSVSYGTAIAALNLPLSSGDEVLFLAEEFPSNLYSWRVKAKANNASIKMVERPGDNDWTSAVLAALDAKVKIAVLPHTHWIDGGQLALETISVALKARGIALVLDLTQSLGVVAVDVKTIAPDFLICATYKWLLGPYSLGFVYVHPDHQQGVPLEQGWINRPGAEDFSRLIDYVDDINPDASRFDMGERANFQLMPIAIAAMTQIHQWGQANIEASLRAYTSKLAAKMAPLGLSTCDEAFRSPHYLGVCHENGLPQDLLSRLADEKIYISQRGDRLRITPHLYNNQNDADCLIDALARILA